ncbi:MAG: conserved repeat protein domain protein [Verrucomicrobiaceae bacterium]|nr:conserved repeat protein domain protein [Verrucomicrobiaceae bacterium]
MKSPLSTGFRTSPMGRCFSLACLAAGLLITGIHAWGHNLDMATDYLGFDKATLDAFEARAAAHQALLQVGDTVGLLMKATPNLGTPTGAGGYSTLFIPVGTQVVKADYGYIDASGQFIPTAVKGQSILALGDGAIGAKLSPNLIGLQLGPNINGQTAMAVDALGFANGTMVGVYSDTGIFYSTDPKTAWQSWVNTGGMDNSVATSADNYITTNSSDRRSRRPRSSSWASRPWSFAGR